MSEPISSSAAQAVASAVVKTSPPWLVTALALFDLYSGRVMLAMSILLTATHLYLSIRKIWRERS